MEPGPIRNAAQALHFWELRHQVMSNNLANASTVGFRGERVFAELLANELVVPGTAMDQRAGPLTATNAPLDIALGNSDYLVVRTANGDRLIRGGAFELDTAGRLVDRHGDPLMSEGGELVLPPGKVEIDRNGLVTVDQLNVGSLRVVRVGDPNALTREDAVRFDVDPELVRDVRASERDVRQGFLEESNVRPLESMVDMITIQRAYGSVERALETLDSTMSLIVNDLARTP